MFLLQGHQIRKLYHEGELELLKTMVLLVENIRQDEAAAATAALLDRFHKADFGMLYRAAVEEMWKRHGNRMKMAPTESSS
jgi:hypothetical protein